LIIAFYRWLPAIPEILGQRIIFGVGDYFVSIFRRALNAVQVALREHYRAFKVGALKVGVLKLSVSDVGAYEADALEMSVLEVGALEVGGREVGSLEGDALRIDDGEGGVPEVSIPKMGCQHYF
jgi:hypothetical protein